MIRRKWKHPLTVRCKRSSMVVTSISPTGKVRRVRHYIDVGAPVIRLLPRGSPGEERTPDAPTLLARWAAAIEEDVIISNGYLLPDHQWVMRILDAEGTEIPWWQGVQPRADPPLTRAQETATSRFRYHQPSMRDLRKEQEHLLRPPPIPYMEGKREFRCLDRRSIALETPRDTTGALWMTSTMRPHHKYRAYMRLRNLAMLQHLDTATLGQDIPRDLTRA